jgi:hypothetical protein
VEPLEHAANNDAGDQRMMLIVAGIIAVLVGLGLAFAWPW